MSTTANFPDGQTRCAWVSSWDAYIAYHDHEWGMPIGDDTALFERMSLEGFQSGLSWRTILAKREAFRAAFAGFDVARVARFDEHDVARLLQDAGIVRHRGKIEAVINNARQARALRETGRSLSALLWRYEPQSVRPADAPPRPTAPESEALSKDLRKQGWKFVGPTTMYALMQAVGMVNDHGPDCICRKQTDAARAAFKRPTV